jgi:acyl dehydratase
MNQPTGLTIDSSGVGRVTIANSEYLDARRALLFAAGIEEQGPAYVDDHRDGGLMVHPGIAFALQFNAQKRLGVVVRSSEAWIGAVHAETDLRLHRAFQLGDVVTTQGQVVARRQIKSGVYNLERYRMTGGDGELIAELDFVLIFRGGTLTGGDRDLDPAPPRPMAPAGEAPVLLREMFVPRSLLHHYTGCSGIFAPIHTEQAVAVAAGFPDIILQGSATKSIALSAVVAAYFDGDPSRVTRFYGQLRHVILADTDIRIEVLGMVEDGQQRHVFFHVLNADGKPAIANGLVSGWHEGGLQ